MLPDQVLTQINTQDLLEALGLENAPGRRLWEALCRLPARRFTRQVLEYDRQVQRLGLPQASINALPTFTREMILTNLENVPKEGPVLFLSNHPGMADTLALFASIQRRDLLVVAAGRPFLRALPNVSNHLLFVSESSHERSGVVRAAARHLRRGGAVLTFPAGKIEPDPAVMPGAAASLNQWSPSAAFFARLAPNTAVVPVLVSGVIWGRALRHPLTRLRRAPADRERLGATLQLLAQTLLDRKPVSVQVQFGQPVFTAELPELSPGELMDLVKGRMLNLIQRVESASAARGERRAEEPAPNTPAKESLR